MGARTRTRRPARRRYISASQRRRRNDNILCGVLALAAFLIAALAGWGAIQQADMRVADGLVTLALVFACIGVGFVWIIGEGA